LINASDDSIEEVYCNTNKNNNNRPNILCRRGVEETVKVVILKSTLKKSHKQTINSINKVTSPQGYFFI